MPSFTIDIDFGNRTGHINCLINKEIKTSHIDKPFIEGKEQGIKQQLGKLTEYEVVLKKPIKNISVLQMYKDDRNAWLDDENRKAALLLNQEYNTTIITTLQKAIDEYELNESKKMAEEG